VPEPDYASLLSAIEGPYTILQTVGAGEKSGRIFLLLQQEDLYRICIATYEDTGWQLEAQSSLLPKRWDVAPQLHSGTYNKSDDILYMAHFYLDYYDGITPQTEGDIVSDVTYTFRRAPDASWQLVDFNTGYHVGDAIHYSGGAFLSQYWISYGGSFAAGAPREDRWVLVKLDRDLRSFSVDGIPLTPDDALRMVNPDNLAMVNNPGPEDKLHLRSGPSRDSRSLGKYYNGSFVTILEYTDNEWARVDILGVEGYMMHKYLALPAQYDDVKWGTTQWGLDSEEPQPLYQSPSDSADIVAYVSLRTDMYLYGVTETGWSHVLYENMGGYIQSDYLRQ